MNENSPSSSEQAVLVNRTHRRLWTLTIASLCLNGLILFLFLLGFIAHHHREKIARQNFAGDRGGCESCGNGDFHRHFHHGGDRGGWGRDRGGDFGPRDRFDRQRDDFAGPRDRGGDDRGPDGGRGPGGWGHGFGGAPGLMGHGNPPDPAILTDAILAHLTQNLTLSDDQKAKIKPIVQDQVTLIQKQMTDAKTAFQKQISDGKAKIRPLLNADQQKQLDQMKVPGDKAETQPADAGGLGPI